MFLEDCSARSIPLMFQVYLALPAVHAVAINVLRPLQRARSHATLPDIMVQCVLGRQAREGLLDFQWR